MDTDWISNLPNEVLGQILSLTPTKVAASTSVLSKRWRYLFTLVDSLDFDEAMLLYPHRKDAQGDEPTSRDSRCRRRYRFSDFVDKTLAPSPACPPIKKFSLICYFEDDESRINRWIRTALERGCMELYLEAGSYLSIDSEFFASTTLVKLTISNGFYPEGILPPGGVFFSALKTLSLGSVYFKSHEMRKRFIHGCSALEEMFIYEWMGYLSSPYVKRVTITSDFDDNFELYCHKLKTPSLVYLDYSSYVAADYKVSLNSLVEARLDLRLNLSNITYDVMGDAIYGNVTSLIEGMSNIKSLHLSPDSLEVFYLCCYAMPVFNNLLNLSIESNKEKGWEVMPNLLNKSPNLQTLVMKGLVHKVTLWCGEACPCNHRKKRQTACCLSRCRVQVLEISGYGGSCGELNQMKHFLGKLECLEAVRVGVEEDSNELRANLMALPRVSSKCNILFI